MTFLLGHIRFPRITRSESWTTVSREIGFRRHSGGGYLTSTRLSSSMAGCMMGSYIRQQRSPGHRSGPPDVPPPPPAVPELHCECMFPGTSAHDGIDCYPVQELRFPTYPLPRNHTQPGGTPPHNTTKCFNPKTPPYDPPPTPVSFAATNSRDRYPSPVACP